MNSITDVNKKINQIQRFSDLQGVKLSYHEAGHVLVSYSVGITIQYISCQFQIIPTKRPNAIEIETISRFEVYHNIPQWLVLVLSRLQYGGTISAISQSLGIPHQTITGELKKYAQILVAGKVAEKQFRSLRLWFLKRKVMKTGVNIPFNQLAYDYERIKMIKKHVPIDIRKYEQNAKRVIKHDNNFNALKCLALTALEKQVIYLEEIELILKQNRFTPIQLDI